MKQAGLRRLELDRNLYEQILGVIPVDPNEDLTEVLQSFYQELVELEARQKNLKDQKQKITRMVILAEEEEATIANLLPVLRQRLSRLERVEERLTAMVKMQTVPEKADEIIARFQGGEGPPMVKPTPAPEGERTRVIDRAADTIFNSHVRILALRNWVEILEERLRPSGIDSEINEFTDKSEKINAREFVVARHIKALYGTPESDKNETQIVLLRADNLELRREVAYRILVTLAAILIAVLILHWLAMVMVDRMGQRFSVAGDKGERPRESAFLHLLRNTLKGSIWIGGILAVLHTLGFKVGAILAGLGIGGLALAMASKETLSDMIGGINLMLSNSLKVGEEIDFNGMHVKVEHMGLRYTRLRPGENGFLITVPNRTLAESNLTNMTRNPAGYKVNLAVPVSVHNNSSQVERARQLMKQAVDNHPDTTFENIFNKFDKFVFTIHMRYQVPSPSARYRLQAEINTEVIRLFQRNNIEFPEVKLDAQA